jgi:uncharacterized membrane protein YuzA (DUF378 family)
MKLLKTVSKWLVVVGAINWGLVGLLNINLVTLLLGSLPWLVVVVYTLVGLCGLWGAYAMLTNKKKK